MALSHSRIDDNGAQWLIESQVGTARSYPIRIEVRDAAKQLMMVPMKTRGRDLLPVQWSSPRMMSLALR
jgi:hypothetical protein